MHNVADVGLVDAHPERIRGDEQGHRVVDESSRVVPLALLPRSTVGPSWCAAGVGQHRLPQHGGSSSGEFHYAVVAIDMRGEYDATVRAGSVYREKFIWRHPEAPRQAAQKPDERLLRI